MRLQPAGASLQAVSPSRDRVTFMLLRCWSMCPTTRAVAREEFFGPVALMFTFKTEEEAIRLANDTEFGLGAAVWSKNAERANAVAARIEAGAVFINDFVRSDPRAPFGGVKGSGVGRELGALGARELTNAKLVWETA